MQLLQRAPDRGFAVAPAQGLRQSHALTIYLASAKGGPVDQDFD